MEFIAKSCLILTFIVARMSSPTSAQDHECDTMLRSFVDCVKTDVTQREIVWVNEANGLANDRVTDCFTSRGFKGPNFTAPLDVGLSMDSQNVWQNLSAWWKSVDPDQRYCVISEIRGNFKQKVQQCVTGANPGFNIPGPWEPNGILAAERANITFVAHHQFRIHMALRQAGDMEEEIHDCLRKQRNVGIFAQLCAVRRDCASRVSAHCKNIWANKIRAPICGCVTEAAGNVKKKILPNIHEIKLKADIIKLKCRVALPTVDVSAIEADKELHARIKDFLMLHEDEAIYRRIPVCSECIGLQM